MISIMPLGQRWLQFFKTVNKYLHRDSLQVELKRLTSAEGLRKILDNTVRISSKNYSRILTQIYLENSIRILKKTMVRFVTGLGLRKHKFMKSGKQAKKLLKLSSLSLNTLKLITAVSKNPLCPNKNLSSQTSQRQIEVVKSLQLLDQKEVPLFLSEQIQ